MAPIFKILLRKKQFESILFFQIETGYFAYIVDGQTAVLTTNRINDGEWHRVEIVWLVGGGVRISLDYDKRAVTKTLNAKVQGLYVGKITLGKLEDSKIENMNAIPFRGCIQVNFCQK